MCHLWHLQKLNERNLFFLEISEVFMIFSISFSSHKELLAVTCSKITRKRRNIKIFIVFSFFKHLSSLHAGKVDVEVGRKGQAHNCGHCSDDTGQTVVQADCRHFEHSLRNWRSQKLLDLDSSNVHPELKGFKMRLRSDDPDSDECELNKDAALQVLIS